MIEVVMSEQHGLYRLLPLQGERSGQAPGIQRYLSVYQEAGQPEPVGLGIMRTEDLDFHFIIPLLEDCFTVPAMTGYLVMAI
jgi:hypothetical protein